MPESAARITALILSRPTCLECLADKALMSIDRVQAILETIGEALKLNRTSTRCRVCGETRQTYSVDGP